MIKNEKTNCIRVEKGWGHELIFANNSLYCGKLLVFRAGKRSSMHYHLLKDETWYVASGKVRMIWIDPVSGKKYWEILETGDVITNKRGHPHQIEAVEESTIFEVSTEHFDSDSYRVEVGDIL
jgi:quercetin dioxygenase-like cupin family protein